MLAGWYESCRPWGVGTSGEPWQHEEGRMLWPRCGENCKVLGSFAQWSRHVEWSHTTQQQDWLHNLYNLYIYTISICIYNDIKYIYLDWRSMTPQCTTFVCLKDIHVYGASTSCIKQRQHHRAHGISPRSCLQPCQKWSLGIWCGTLICNHILTKIHELHFAFDDFWCFSFNLQISLLLGDCCFEVCDCRGFQLSKNLDPRPAIAAMEVGGVVAEGLRSREKGKDDCRFNGKFE